MNPSGSGPRYDQPGSRLIQFGVSRRSESQRCDRQRSAVRPRSSTTWSTPASVSSWLTARPAWPAPMTRRRTRRRVAGHSGASGRSAGSDDPAGSPRDGSGARSGRRGWSTSIDDVGAVGQHVVDGRPPPGLLDQGGQLLGGGVALDDEADPDLPVAVADLRRTDRGCRAGRCRPRRWTTTRCSVTPRAAAMLPSPEVRQAAMACSRNSTGGRARCRRRPGPPGGRRRR